MNEEATELLKLYKATEPFREKCRKKHQKHKKECEALYLNKDANNPKT